MTKWKKNIENSVLPKYMLLWGGSFLELVSDPVLEDAKQSCKFLNTLNTLISTGTEIFKAQ